MMDRAFRHLRYASRLLARAPLFTMTAAASLAIGIGANVAIFSVANRLPIAPTAGVRGMAIGTALGAAGALLLTRLLADLLFGISPHDPLTFAVTAGVLAAIGIAATYPLARRAARVDPMVALRRD